jgi:predicted XRE-type DNA-binding protein
MEIWKDVKGYEDYYSVSNTGKILSKRKNKLLSFGDNGRGYLFVNFYNEKGIKRFYVHRIIALSFLDNKENKTQVNHKDCNKSNNNIDNLEWNTADENIKHAVKNKRFYTSEFQKQQTSKANRGSNSKVSKLKEKQVVLIKKYLKLNKYTQKQIAEMFGTTTANVGAIKRNKSWVHISI